MSTESRQPRFTYDAEGYENAVAWLKSVGKLETVLNSGFSNDGWSVIHEANAMQERFPEFPPVKPSHIK